MRMRETVLAAVIFVASQPAAAFEDFGPTRNPKAITEFAVRGKQIEMLAVTRLARADTPLRRAYLEESLAMGKVMPGFPQPAFVTVDFRIKF